MQTDRLTDKTDKGQRIEPDMKIDRQMDRLNAGRPNQSKRKLSCKL